MDQHCLEAYSFVIIQGMGGGGGGGGGGGQDHLFHPLDQQMPVNYFQSILN